MEEGSAKVIMSTTAGDVNFQFAQNQADVTNTTIMKAGSYMSVWEAV